MMNLHHSSLKKIIIHHLLNKMKVKIINRSEYALPRYQTDGAAGMDLRAVLPDAIQLLPLQRFMIPTGISIELPVGYEAQVRPRSGLAAKKGLTCLNTPGTIDSDYRGEIHVILVNLSPEPQIIEPGERVAQMVIARYERVNWLETNELSVTERGAGGFGSTGQK